MSVSPVIIKTPDFTPGGLESFSLEYSSVGKVAKKNLSSTTFERQGGVKRKFTYSDEEEQFGQGATLRRKIEDAVTPNLKTVSQYEKRMQRAWQERDLNEANDIFVEAQDADKLTTPLCVHYLKLAIEANSYQDAQKAFYRAREGNTNSGYLNNLYTSFLFGRGYYAEAKAVFDQIVSSGQDNTYTYSTYIKGNKEGDYTETKRAYKLGLERDRLSPYLFSHFIEVAIQQGESDDASDALDEAEETKCITNTIYSLYLTHIFETGEACSIIRRAKENGVLSSNLINQFFRLVDSNQTFQGSDEVLAIAQKCKLAEIMHYSQYIKLAFLYENAQKAEDALKSAIKCKQVNVKLFTNYIIYAIAAKDFAKARSAFEKAEKMGFTGRLMHKIYLDRVVEIEAFEEASSFVKEEIFPKKLYRDLTSYFALLSDKNYFSEGISLFREFIQIESKEKRTPPASVVDRYLQGAIKADDEKEVAYAVQFLKNLNDRPFFSYLQEFKNRKWFAAVENLLKIATEEQRTEERLQALTLKGRFVSADKIFSEIKRPKRKICETYIHALTKMGAYEKALQIFQKYIGVPKRREEELDLQDYKGGMRFIALLNYLDTVRPTLPFEVRVGWDHPATESSSVDLLLERICDMSNNGIEGEALFGPEWEDPLDEYVRLYGEGKIRCQKILGYRERRLITPLSNKFEIDNSNSEEII